MSAPTTTKNLSMQSFFSTTLSSPILSSDTVIPLNAVPSGSEGFLTIDEDNSSREIIYYNTKGGSSVTCPSAASGRGQGGTSAVAHSSGATVKLTFVDQYWSELQNGNALAAGIPVQVVATNFSAVATGTTTLPYDDTIPQNTEGDQYMTQTITPKSANNHLLIEAVLYLASSASVNDMTAALFQDSTANALAAGNMTTPVASYATRVTVTHDMVAGTTSATTFKIRAGGSVAGTTTFNGAAAGRKFGGITLSSFKITEYKA